MENAISRWWRTQSERYRLQGVECPICSEKIFPPRDICPTCNNKALSHCRFSGKGEVYSLTTVYEAPIGYEEQAPFVVALVKLAEGPLITAQITDDPGNSVGIGSPVEMVTRKLREDGERGVIIYGYKFRPPLEP